MENNEPLPQKLMVLIALIQGLCLLWLHQVIELGYWPNKEPQWLFAFYTVALVLPVMLLLSLREGKVMLAAKYCVPFALLCGLLGYYLGTQATPVEHIRYKDLWFAFGLTISLATFKALMYIQQIAAGERFTYAALFRWSWRNFLTLFLALLFTGCFRLVLLLWAELFDAINIRFFKDLFREPWFYYPVLALANGFGVIIFRSLTQVIDTITRLQQALMKFLLILLVLISVLFLCALPFTGLAPLWESGGSALILWMQALMLFCVNAVYQDEPEQRPYMLWLHRFVYLGVALLPIYSAIAFYGLSLRVDQYGWTLARCWAFLIWFLLALLPLGYWWGIARKRDHWVEQLSRVNVAVGLVVLAMMLLINSPLLDFRKVVVNDQLARLNNNEVTMDDFDFFYFYRDLAKPGYEALQLIKEQYAESHPAVVLRINQFYSDRESEPQSSSKEEFIAAITVLADEVPRSLFDAMYEHESSNSWSILNTTGYYLQAIDLDDDLEPDFVLASETHGYIHLKLYYLEKGVWKNVEMNAPFGLSEDEGQAMLAALKSGEFKVVPPRWNHFEITGKTFQIMEDRK